MGTAKLNIWTRNVNCEPLLNVWRSDYVIQLCSGSYLVDVFPEILDQLKKRYSNPGKVVDVSSWPLADQGTKTLELTIAGGTMQSHTFSAGTQSLMQVYNQIKSVFTNCEITIENGHLKIVTDKYGPQGTIVTGGTCDIVWGPVENGDGYEITSQTYQGAKRITVFPPAGEYVNHLEADIPPGCYKIWTRVCHGNNEETSVVMVNVKCGDEGCVNLLLPQLKTCAAYVMHPLMDKIVYEQHLADDDQRLVAFRAVMYGAQIAKAEVLNQLNYRLAEAVAKADTELQNRINAVLTLANQLPECI